MQNRLYKGFTLIEVVIATFIVGMALIAVVGTIQSITQQTTRIEEKFVANLVANNTLAELQLRSQWPDVGEEDFDYEMAGRTWFADVKVEATDVDTLRRVEINVGLDDDEHVSSTYLLGFVSANSPIAQRPVDWLKLNNNGQTSGTNSRNLNPQNPAPPPRTGPR